MTLFQAFFVILWADFHRPANWYVRMGNKSMIGNFCVSSFKKRRDKQHQRVLIIVTKTTTNLLATNNQKKKTHFVDFTPTIICSFISSYNINIKCFLGKHYLQFLKKKKEKINLHYIIIIFLCKYLNPHNLMEKKICYTRFNYSSIDVDSLTKQCE